MSAFDIALRIDPYDIALNQLQSGTANVTPSTADVPEISCQADTMKKYREKLSELEVLLEEYKVLLQKDHIAMKSVQSNMVSLDGAIAGRYRYLR